MVSAICKNCFNAIHLPDHFAGRRAECPNCGRPVEFPHSETSAPDSSKANPAQSPLAAQKKPHIPPPRPGQATRPATTGTPTLMRPENPKKLGLILAIFGGLAFVLLCALFGFLLYRLLTSTEKTAEAEKDSAPSAAKEQKKGPPWIVVCKEIPYFDGDSVKLQPAWEGRKWVVIQTDNILRPGESAQRTVSATEKTPFGTSLRFGRPLAHGLAGVPPELAQLVFEDREHGPDVFVATAVLVDETGGGTFLRVDTKDRRPGRQLGWVDLTVTPPAFVTSLAATPIAAPSPIRDVLGIGDGSILVRLESDEVHIFDAGSQRFIPLTPQPPKTSLLAIGGNRVVAYDPNTNRFTTYGVLSGEQVRDFDNPAKSRIVGLVMGRSLGERCWIRELQNYQAHTAPRAHIMDTVKGVLLESMNIDISANVPTLFTSESPLRAAPDLLAVASTMPDGFCHLLEKRGKVWGQKRYPGRGTVNPVYVRNVIESNTANHFVSPIHDTNMSLTVEPESGFVGLRLNDWEGSPHYIFGAIPGWKPFPIQRIEGDFGGAPINFNEPRRQEMDLAVSYHSGSGFLIVVAPDRKSILVANHPFEELVKYGNPTFVLGLKRAPLAKAKAEWRFELPILFSKANVQFELKGKTLGATIDASGAITWPSPRLRENVPLEVELELQGGRKYKVPIEVFPEDGY